MFGLNAVSVKTPHGCNRTKPLPAFKHLGSTPFGFYASTSEQAREIFADDSEAVRIIRRVFLNVYPKGCSTPARQESSKKLKVLTVRERRATALMQTSTPTPHGDFPVCGILGYSILQTSGKMNFT